MSAPRPVDVGSLSRRLDAIERSLDHLDGSRRLSFTGTVAQAGANPGRLPDGWGTAASVDVRVPEWCWRVHLLAVASVSAYADEYDLAAEMRSRVVIEGDRGPEAVAVTGGVASEALHVSLAAYSRDVEEPPPVVTVGVETWTQGDLTWPGDSRNRAEVNALVLFLR